MAAGQRGAMQSNLHGSKAKERTRLDQEVERFLQRVREHQGADPEPVLRDL